MGEHWRDFALAPQTNRLAIGGEDKEGKGSIEVWELAGLDAKAASTPSKNAPAKETPAMASDKQSSSTNPNSRDQAETQARELNLPSRLQKLLAIESADPEKQTLVGKLLKEQGDVNQRQKFLNFAIEKLIPTDLESFLTIVLNSEEDAGIRGEAASMLGQRWPKSLKTTARPASRSAMWGPIERSPRGHLRDRRIRGSLSQTSIRSGTALARLARDRRWQRQRRPRRRPHSGPLSNHPRRRAPQTVL